jgi:hypothetical protein
MLKRIMVFVLVSAACGVLLPGCARPHRGSQAMVAENAAAGWKLLGKRTAQGQADVDEIPVTYRDGTFTKVKLEVTGSRLEMSNVVIFFANGETFSPDTRLVFGKGTQSRVIDLPGASRVIQKVRFRYGNLPGGGRATVALFAR